MSSGPAYVIDASVFVADALPPQPFHPDANRLLTLLTARRSVVYVPILALAEIAAAITRGLDDPHLAREAVKMYRAWPGVHIIFVDESLGNLAAEVAATYRIRGCDAVYVALAQMKHAVLITLDGQQRERAPAQVRARTPAGELAVIDRG